MAAVPDSGPGRQRFALPFRHASRSRRAHRAWTWTFATAKRANLALPVHVPCHTKYDWRIIGLWSDRVGVFVHPRRQIRFVIALATGAPDLAEGKTTPCVVQGTSLNAGRRTDWPDGLEVL